MTALRFQQTKTRSTAESFDPWNNGCVTGKTYTIGLIGTLDVINGYLYGCVNRVIQWKLKFVLGIRNIKRFKNCWRNGFIGFTKFDHGGEITLTSRSTKFFRNMRDDLNILNRNHFIALVCWSIYVFYHPHS
ncbi:hypothetical protein RsoM2USA_111 [Ralstonia phage RsoM2USA]|nr:hypothetical protein RsoM2USA_111 [Ralstonia phage RsoM2USA]